MSDESKAEQKPISPDEDREEPQPQSRTTQETQPQSDRHNPLSSTIVDVPYSLAPFLPAQLAEPISKASAEQVIQFLNSYHDRETRLKEQELKFQQELALAKENNCLRETQDSLKIIKFAIACFAAILIVVLIYAGVTEDQTISEKLIDKLITLGAGVLGGSGFALSRASRRQKQEENDKK